MNENFKNNKVDEEKCQKKLAQIHEFLAEIYDLQKDYEKAYDSYDKCPSADIYDRQKYKETG